MPTRKSLLLFAVVIASVMVFAATEVRAHFPEGVPVTSPAPLTCNTLPYNKWKIEAVLGDKGEFPVVVPCSSNHPSQLCVKYEYKVTSSKGRNADHAVIAISAGLDLDSIIDPGFHPASVFLPGDGDNATGFLSQAFHEYGVRFNPKASIANLGVLIVGPPSERISTILVRGGKHKEACLIAGPGPGIGDAVANVFKPLPLEQTYLCAGGKCVCKLTFDASGELQSVSTDTPECQKIEEEIFLNGEPVKFFGDGDGDGEDSITSGNGTCTTYPTKPLSTTICFR